MSRKLWANATKMPSKHLYPKFHTKGSPHGDFYVLAFVRGLYARSQKAECEAFLVLNYSPSKNFTSFSFEINTLDNRLQAYKRGLDENDNLETAMLTAWYEYKVPPHFWMLFPKNHISKKLFANKFKHARQYFENREQLCFLFRQFRYNAWFESKECAERMKWKYAWAPLFEFKDTPVIRSQNEYEDCKDVSEGAMAYFVKWQKQNKSA
jgi:hypothetical protein